MKSLFEQNGGTYSTFGDYRLPNLLIPDVPDYIIGIWGQRRLNHLKHHRRILYVNLLTSGKLNEHLCEIETAAFERREIIIQLMSVAHGLTEHLKAENQMEWVSRMNNICACADVVICDELIYN